MANEVHAYPVPEENLDEIKEAVQNGDGFKVIGQSEFPSFIPGDLAKKFDSATQVVSGSASDTPVVMYNFNRIDETEVDEHPYGVLLLSGSTAISGSFLDHGDWSNRTTRITAEHAQKIKSSGIGDYFVDNPKSEISSGSFDELPESDRNAFNQFLGSVFDSSDFE